MGLDRQKSRPIAYPGDIRNDSGGSAQRGLSIWASSPRMVGMLGKAEILEAFHKRVQPLAVRLAASELDRGDKSDQVNAAATAVLRELAKETPRLAVADRPSYALTLQYCFSVIILEYRHMVWPYEYMAFSRRVGELWGNFCSAAWDYPSRASVTRIKAPSFEVVRDTLLARITTNVGGHAKKDELLQDVATLFEIVGEINMKEDEVFTVDNAPHVVDFKSGFGSNEKGNMLRLQTVGRAYRIWNKDTRLLLLVRQDENNNYLNVLRRMGLWEVHTGNSAYSQISELTGANVQAVRDGVVNWERDLTPGFFAFLRQADLVGYLAW
jgi:hypothetical protein